MHNNPVLFLRKAGLFSLKKVAEMFGGFEDFLYLCSVVQEWITRGGRQLADGYSCIVSNTIKNTTKGMIELYLSKVTESSETETAGKLYARVSYKQTMDLHDMAHHMAEHNTAFSEGLIVGVLTDFVKCVREMVLNGNTVKVGNLAIFKATVESNGLEVLYDAQSDKVASATMGTLKEGDKTGAAVKTIKLLAQSTGDFTRDEPGERLFLQLQKVLPSLVHHQLPLGCKDFGEYYLKISHNFP